MYRTIPLCELYVHFGAVRLQEFKHSQSTIISENNTHVDSNLFLITKIKEIIPSSNVLNSWNALYINIDILV
jgi:hypothetical protein